MASLSYTNEVAVPGEKPVDIKNLLERGKAFANFAQVAPLGSGAQLSGTCVLGKGTYPAVRLTSAFDVSGLNGPLVGRCVVSATGVFRGCVFPNGLELTDTAVVQLTGCVVQGEIAVASGGRLSAAGGAFTVDGYINNAGAPVNAASVGCIKTSATAHVNVGTIIEV